MVSQAAARTAVGLLGNVISLFLFLSPSPTIVRIWRKGSVEQYSAAPYLATLMSSMMWAVYGLPMVHPHSFLIITINATGTAIELLYVLIFLVFSDKTTRLRLLLIVLSELVSVAVVAFLVLTLVHTWETRSAVVGIVCVLFNIVMYASPLTVMKVVMATKSVEFMPFWMSMASFGNGVTWTVYALIPIDKYIFIPNGIGTLFSVAQLIVYATYYNNTKRILAARQAKAELGLDQVVVSPTAHNGL